MKGAAAVLGCALLFFLGVLTGASGEGRSRAAPPAISLGPRPVSSQADGSTPATGGDQPAAPVGSGPAPAPEEEPAVPASDPSAGDSDASSVPPAGEEPSTPGGSGDVEEVGGQVDCVEVGTGPADGGCPPGQAKKIADPPDKKGDGDGRP
ncbi:MAG: hypothetical protein ACRD0O_12890 [Acidimicrobiia bacterium]